MEQEAQFRICRTCLKTINKREKVLPVYKVSDMLMSYTSLTIKENDGLPPNICSSCNKQANQAYKFKLLCEESDQKLRNNLRVCDAGASSIEQLDASKDIKLENDSDSNISYTLPEESSNVLSENGSVKFIVKLEYNSGEEKEVVHQGNTTNENHEILCDIERKVHSDSRSNSQRSEKPKTTDKNKRLQCRYCDMIFMHQTRLVKHQMKHENGIRCYICGRDYLTFKQLASHISIHNRKGAHLCQTCGKQFTLPENLVRHQRIHSGIRPYICKLCNKSFTQSNELKSHMITHSSEKTHLCNVCGNKYARQMSLRVHMRRLHSDSSMLRPYRCDICDRAFKDKRDLSQHTTIHKGERKHICKVCCKPFNRSSNLKVHERIHSGYRPFVCHICNRAFIQKHVLNTHLRTHPNT